jgi:hypothetical protein
MSRRGRRPIHGMTETPTWEAWSGMKKRCYNRNCQDYPNYGGRGIRVCHRWRYNFLAFLADMGPRPSSKHSIDRKDGNKGYNRKNCWWATVQQQVDNRACTVRITYKGQTRVLREWVQQTGIAASTLFYRLHAGWPVSRVLTKPASLRGEHHPAAKLTRRAVVAIRASSHSSTVLARKYDITARSVRRIRAGERWTHA